MSLRLLTATLSVVSSCTLFPVLANPPAKTSAAAVKPVRAAAVAATVPQYALQDLGTLTPGGAAQPLGINQRGEVFGYASPYSYNYTPAHVFFWSSQGGMIDIGALPFSPPSFNQSQAPITPVAINDLGQITGISEIASSIPGQPFATSVNRAFLWTPGADRKSGVIQDLGTLGLNGDAYASTSAVAINNAGQVIGLENPNNFYPEGFLWTPGGTEGVSSNPQMKDLGQLQPSLLDNQGRVIGVLNGILTVYDGHNFVSLGDPPGFNPNGQRFGFPLTVLRLDAQGDIYGTYTSQTQNGLHAFVWVPDQPGGTKGSYIEGDFITPPVPPAGSLPVAGLPAGAQLFWSTQSLFAFDPKNAVIDSVDLGGLVFDTIREGNPYFPPFESYIFAKNSRQDLVGYCPFPNGGSTAFLEHAGLIYDLNRHIVSSGSSGYSLLEAVGITDAGLITALGQPTSQLYGNWHAFLLTPTVPAAAAAPTIQLIQPQPPDAGDPAQTVDIQGTGFQVGAAISYDGTPLTATVYAETQILATIPSVSLTAGKHTITVTNPDGQAGSGLYTVLPVRPVPSLISVNPMSLPAGSPDTAITFTGTGLYPETQVGYGYSLSVTLLTVLSASADHTRITVLVPASAMTQGTTLTFYANTPGQRGNSGNAPAPMLTILNPVPVITSISPPTIAADTVSSFLLTVNGSHFVPGTQISWNGQYFPTTYVSPTQVTAGISGYNLNYPGPDTISPGPVTVSVINSSPGGGSASTTQIVTDGPYPAPTLTSVSPSVIAPGVGTYIFLSGSHFLHHSVIQIGTQSYPFAIYGNSLSADRTQITLYVPAVVVPPVGTYSVTVINPGPGGGKSAGQILTVQGADVRVSGANLTRDPFTQEIIVQATLSDSYRADADGVVVTQATLGTAAAKSVPVKIGAIPAGTTTTVTLRYPAATAAPNSAVVLHISGQYNGGSFTSSRRVIAP